MYKNKKYSKEIYDKIGGAILGEYCRRSNISEIRIIQVEDVKKRNNFTLYEVQDQLQELREVMFDREMTTVMLNALPKGLGNLT